MKKLISILLITIPLSLSAYTWTDFGPSGVHANDIIFNVGANNAIVICANDGLHVSYDAISWSFYTTFGLPVHGAVPYNDTSFIFIMGDGSFSDGIYLFSFNSFQYSVLNWTYKPEFIYQNDHDDYYYTGYYSGLLYSEEGLDWNDIPYFSGKKCVWMDNSYSYYLVSQIDSVHDLHYSADGGKKWAATNCPYQISEFLFKCTGELYGIFPGFSNSSGLYSSLDYGLSWSLEAYSDNINTIGYDAIVNIFTGWENSSAADDGVAIYNLSTNNFDFINAGLPNRNINRFGIDPFMSSISLFTCTDSGVYILQNYLVDIQEQLSPAEEVSVFPNPITNQATIVINAKEAEHEIVITLYNSSGALVRSNKVELEGKSNNNFSFYRNDLTIRLILPGDTDRKRGSDKEDIDTIALFRLYVVNPAALRAFHTFLFIIRRYLELYSTGALDEGIIINSHHDIAHISLS
jgi:hypothetical protein